ncbi:MAG: TIGR01777 family oxidoreductase [Flavobacteriales bacterium]|nr:TIGR01777 family oxidoreductase [Flavobacteriales bacterium]MDW8409914.1 TIGR01777 family oxidoreductase [Flavobacteriales bacterium]
MGSRRRVLIAGGTGLVGRALQEILPSHAYEVAVLSRRGSSGKGPIKIFEWQPEKRCFDPALKDWPPDAVVNLAGENVGSGVWTEARRLAILRSRVEALETLARAVELWSASPKVISISASGYYGHVPGSFRVDENWPSGQGFLAEVCKHWEEAARKYFGKESFRLLIFRLGVVLDPADGALPRILRPIRFLFGQPLGCGTQMVSWIHRRDVALSLRHGLDNPELTGVYNLAAPQCVSQAEFTRILCRVAGRWYVPVPVPSMVLRVVLGRQADLVLHGVAMDVGKWKGTGYKFCFSDLESALRDLLNVGAGGRVETA